MSLTSIQSIVVATQNEGKVKEFRKLFQSLSIEIKSLADVENVPGIIEDGNTFAENAYTKAAIIAEHLQLPTVADDSGLCVERLDGAPGVWSARYAGEGATDELNNRKLLNELKQLPPNADDEQLLSAAQFVCALAFVDPKTGQVIHAEGQCSGMIISEPRGTNGFGYDPLFYLPQYKKTMAELSLELKNKISHRGEALKQLLSHFTETL